MVVPWARKTVEAARGQLGELLLARGARRVDGQADAAAALQQLEVADAGEPLAVLGGPLAGEDGVRVTVDEAGQHAGTLGVEFDGVGREADLASEVGLAADPHDLPFVCGERPAGEHAEPLSRRTHHGHELAGVAQHEVGEPPALVVGLRAAGRSRRAAARRPPALRRPLLALRRPAAHGTIGRSRSDSRTFSSASG